MNIPANLKYTQDDEWVRVEGEFAFVGITDYAQHELGDIVFVDVTCEGDTVEAGEAFGSVEAVKTVADLLMPVKGEVVEFNTALEDASAINADPYAPAAVPEGSHSGKKSLLLFSLKNSRLKIICI